MNAILGIVGVGVVLAHALVFASYVPGCRRPELVVELTQNADGTAWGVEAEGSIRFEYEGVPGLHYKRFLRRYRGGHLHSAGYASLETEPPPATPEPPKCSGRVVVGQRLLDDGKASPGTIAGEMARSIAAELEGESFVGVGTFERVDGVSLRWNELAKHPEDLPLVGGAQGYVLARAVLVFSRISIPILVGLIPEPTAHKLDFRVVAIAQLELGNSVLQWISDKLGGDKLATRLARRQIDQNLITTLAPPPPFALPGGHQVTFTYCDGPAEIVDGVSGALPFGVLTGVPKHAPEIRPPKPNGPAVHAPLSPTGTLAIDLDVDGANALLFELWRTGFLDQRLADAGLDRRFNSDPTVTEFLTLRITPPRLALPPVLGFSGDKLAMFADARVTIEDGDTKTIGRVWAGLEFSFSGKLEPVGVDLGALELSCERTPTTLVPCFANLVGALRDRGSEFHGELTRTFAKVLDDIFVDQRVGASGLTADLVIRSARATMANEGVNGSLHLELDAALAPKR